LFDGQVLVPRLVTGQIEPKIQGWYSPSYKVKTPATVVELTVARHVREWVVDIEINRHEDSKQACERVAWPLDLPADLADEARVRTSREMVGENGVSEVRLLLEHPEIDAGKLYERVKEAVTAAGYVPLRSGPRRQGLGATFKHQDSGAVLRVLVRAGEAFPVKFPCMRSSIYFALVHSRVHAISGNH